MLAPLLALALAAAAQPNVATLLRVLGDTPMGPERTVRATELLLGAPYALHPLGEGVRPDSQPRLRVDRFDCQTFVETAMALGQSRTEAEVARALDDIRYAGATPSFAERNHFMMSQWVPSNTAKGYLAQPPRGTAVAEKVVTAASWRGRWTRAIVLPEARVPLGRFELPLTSLDGLAARASTIPSGTLMLIVRADRASFPDRVTHLGFVIQRGDQTFFRHASDVFHRVVDEPLDHFLARNRRYAYTVSGVALLPLRDNASRVAALPGDPR